MEKSNLRIPVSPKWYNLLKDGKAKVVRKEITPEWVKLFTTCDENETDVMKLYENIKDCETVTLWVPILKSEITFDVDYYDICSGKQLGLDGKHYFVVFLK